MQQIENMTKITKGIGQGMNKGNLPSNDWFNILKGAINFLDVRCLVFNTLKIVVFEGFFLPYNLAFFNLHWLENIDGWIILMYICLALLMD